MFEPWMAGVAVGIVVCLLVFACTESVSIGLLVGVLLGFLVDSGISMRQGDSYPQGFVVSKEIHLLRLRDGIGVQGSSFLGTGTIDSGAVYIYSEKLFDGGQRIKTLRASDDVTVYEEDRDTGILHVMENQFVDKAHSKGSARDGTKYVFRVPRGGFAAVAKVDEIK